MAEPRAEVLCLGELTQVERRLEALGFRLHRAAARPLAELVAAHGPAIRAIVTRGRDPIPAAVLAALPALEIVASYAIGYDAIDVAAAAARGVVVTNAAGALEDEVADFTVALLLATVRRLPQAERWLRAGRWEHAQFPLGPSLRDRTVGLLGMGRIGRRIAKRLAAFDVPLAYHARRPGPDLPWSYHPDLIGLARAVDTLVVVVPGGEATRHLVDAEVLRALGPRGVLVNVARGSVVDEAALVRALQDGTILAAGLDVYADEPRVPEALLAVDNAVLMPHVGSATHHTRARMGELVVENLVSWFEGRGPLTPVPETPWPGLVSRSP